MKESKNSLGKIEISNDVLSAIASFATAECYGIVGLGKRGPNGLVELFKNEQTGKGIKIISNEDGIIVEIYIVIEYGVNIRTVVENIIQKIKYSIENLTGIRVKNVVVNVQSIKVDNWGGSNIELYWWKDIKRII